MAKRNPVDDLSPLDKDILHDKLHQLVDHEEFPFIPAGRDVDGDGIFDGWALSEDGTDLIFVKGVNPDDPSTLPGGNA